VVQADVGLAAPLPDLRGVGACTSLRAHAPWIGSFGPRFGAARCAFGDQVTSASELYTVAGGLSWRPSLHRRVHLVLEAEAGVAVLSGAGRALLGGALGVDVSLFEGLTVGPVLRYQQIVAGGVTPGDDLRFATFGVVVGFSSDLFRRAPEPPAARPEPPSDPHPATPWSAPAADDKDGDGLPDPDPLARVEPPPAAPSAAPPAAPPVAPVSAPLPAPAAEGDRDRDGVTDATDACPAEPAGLLVDPGRRGCPLPDRDHDLVPDAVDVCPDVTGAPHHEAPFNGCPGAVRVDGNRLRLEEPIVFDIVRLRRASSPTLHELRSVLRTLPPTLRVTIVGHAALEPNPIGRVQLAADRANVVRAWLETHGLRRANLVATPTPPDWVPATPDPATTESVDIWLSLP